MTQVTMIINSELDTVLPILREMGDEVFNQKHVVIVLNLKLHMTAARLIRTMSKDEYEDFLMNNVME